MHAALPSNVPDAAASALSEGTVSVVTTCGATCSALCALHNTYVLCSVYSGAVELQASYIIV
jgi:hypothetical protein